MKTDRYYKFWNKRVSKKEKKATLSHTDFNAIHQYIKQIERSFAMKMITEEQRNELTIRCNRLQDDYIKRYIMSSTLWRV